jgi:phosphotransferase system enzyme I (PtsI)
MSFAAPRVFKGKAASRGYARGPVVRTNVAAPERRRRGDDEAGALRCAIAATRRQIAALGRVEGDEAAAILEFQLELLDDDALVEPAFAAIATGAAADVAWANALAESIAACEAAPDEYQRARAADFVDLRERVLVALAEAEGARSELPRGAIVCAEDLPPSRFLEIDWSAGGGLVLAEGSPTSHVAMLARSRGVPMLVQCGALPDEGPAGLLDGEEATLELDPPPSAVAAFETRRGARLRELERARAALAGEPLAWAGERIRLLVNVQGLADLSHPDAARADGVGLMRTEFLFDGVGGLPDEETQRETYEAVLSWAGMRPVTIRTVDAGGDKPIRGFTAEGEANPFLGVRGLRLSLKRPEIFAVQLCALARAAVSGNLKVMFPMVTVPAEFLAARDLFQKVVDELKSAGVPAALPPLGIMVEVPAAALTIDAFPAEFFSIGSNDLTQYVTACDRSNGALAALSDPLNPGVLELIRRTADCGRRRGVGVSLCGDMAGDPRCAEALLVRGVREFSMSPPALAPVRLAISGLSAAGGHV